MLIKEALQKGFVVFDGAMGTMLQKAGLQTGEIPETYNLVHPEVILDIHRQYVQAGAEVITTNTFQANELKLKGCSYSVEEIIEAGVGIAKQAGAKYVALDMGPLGQLMEPMGTVTFEQAYEIFARQVRAGVKAGVDLVLIETLSDIYEAKAAILAVKENSDLPVFCTITFQQDGRTFIGTDPLTATVVLQSLGADALGVNCSLGPKELLPIVQEICTYAQVPVMVQPNAGLPRMEGEKTVYDVTPEEFATFIGSMADLGVRVFGGCCGTTPEYIAAVQEVLQQREPVNTQPRKITCVTSNTQAVVLDGGVTTIGERINPTGKKKLKEALKNMDLGYILTEAVNQRDKGADILDVNVGLPEIDEAAVISKVIREIQGLVNTPLQIDSASATAIASGARVYNGKPIINSVNGKAEVMAEVFPIVKKYGACVVGLTLDESGIPAKAEGRFAIAEKIVRTAEAYGIPKEDILIDCLVLTASAQQAEVMESIKATALVKANLGVKTILGISNVSFGLPARESLNSTYLAVALGAGLDVAIVNPLSVELMQVVDAFRVLNNEDREAEQFISKYANVSPTTAIIEATDKSLKQLIIEGRKDESARKTQEVLADKTPMQVVEEDFIPALNHVGDRYEKGELFLPQLIQSAEAVHKAFEVIKDRMEANSEETVTKGKVVLATVKGDIHDIGKNIVKMLLENYGFTVIDLGKDVDPQEVVSAVAQHQAKLVGLSALMTTTVKSMETTIEQLRDAQLDCKVMVGGAVLTQEYAQMVGADYYARDARDGVKIANEYYGHK